MTRGNCNNSQALTKSDGKVFQPWKDYMGLSEVIRAVMDSNTSAQVPTWQHDGETAMDSHPIYAERSPSPPNASSHVCMGNACVGWLVGYPSRHEWVGPEIVRAYPPFGARCPHHWGVTASHQHQRVGLQDPLATCCNFCKRNGETEIVYTSHRLKNDVGEVLCPVLRGYVCPLCGATGATAHTKRFCPKVEKSYLPLYTKGRPFKHGNPTFN
ncbi:nanos homolog 3 [Stigmatopora argus]